MIRPGKSSKSSPRRRKLRRTIIVLVLSAMLGVGWGVFQWLHSKSALYNPSETAPGITRNLDAARPKTLATHHQPKLIDQTTKSGLNAFIGFAGSRSSQLPEDMGAGAAWGDYDRDGDEDLMLVSAGGTLNTPTGQWGKTQLFINLGDGRFEPDSSFPELKITGMGCAWGDWDSDGFLDLIVTSYDRLHWFHNRSVDGKRALVPDKSKPDPVGFWTGLAWGDFDNDLDPDLYVCHYVDYRFNESDLAKTSDQLGTFVPYTLNPASFEPGKNLLFINDGAGGFSEHAEAFGIENASGRSLGAIWLDFDQDGYLDLYVANDISDNAFYHNDSGTGFTDISHQAWVADYRSAMGLAVSDWNHDGDDDLFISHWVAQENAFYDNLWSDYNRRHTRSDESNFEPQPSNQADFPLRFMDVNEMCGLGQISIPMVGWGSVFADLNQDGWDDLFVVNGSTLEMPGSNPKRLEPQKNHVFINLNGKKFVESSAGLDALTSAHVGRGLAASDYDSDGDVDLVWTSLDQGAHLLENDSKVGNWIQLRLENRTIRSGVFGEGLGSWVILHHGDSVQRKHVRTESYLSQSSRILHFGLGESSRADWIEVRWLGGEAQFFAGLEAGLVWVLREGEPIPGLWQHSNGPSPSREENNSANKTSRSPADKERITRFWEHQRQGMDAYKTLRDYTKAAAELTQALRLDPLHEDSRFYLSLSLLELGTIEESLAHLEALARINPASHRAQRQWGVVRAFFARDTEDLNQAEAWLKQARNLNPEETGSSLALAELDLLKGNQDQARETLESVVQTNPSSAEAWFWLGYLAFHQNRIADAERCLAQVKKTKSPESIPEGATNEGDTQRLHHRELTPLMDRISWTGIHEKTVEEAFSKVDATFHH